MKRDVLVIAHQYLPSDPRVAKSIAALTDAGASVDVLCLRDQGQPWRDRMGDARLYRLPVRRHRGAGLAVYVVEYVAFFMLSFVAAGLLHVRRRYRTVVTHTLPDPLVFAAAVPRLLGARVVMDMHEFTPELYETRYGLAWSHPLIRIMLALERWSCRFADVAVTVHDPGVDILRRTGVAEERIVVVMNSADPAEEGALLPAADDHPEGVAGAAGAGGTPAQTRDERFTLVYHGTLVNQYDLECAVRALARLDAEGERGFVLRVVGEGPGLEALRRSAREAGLADRVRLQPPVPLAAIPAVLTECDAGVVPMHDVAYAHVALPMKALECMAAGLPVITNPTRVLRHYFDERSVCWVPFGDAAALAEAMRRLRDDGGYRHSLVAGARDAVRPIRWQVMARRFVEACGVGAPRDAPPARTGAPAA